MPITLWFNVFFLFYIIFIGLSLGLRLVVGQKKKLVFSHIFNNQNMILTVCKGLDVCLAVELGKLSELKFWTTN